MRPKRVRSKKRLVSAWLKSVRLENVRASCKNVKLKNVIARLRNVRTKLEKVKLESAKLDRVSQARNV